MKKISVFLLLVAQSVFAISAVFAQETEIRPIYQNSGYPNEIRAKDLLSRMTVEEKVRETMVVPVRRKQAVLSENGELTLGEHFLDEFKTKRGSFFGTASQESTEEAVKIINALQKLAIDSSRLNIPALFAHECLTGLVANGATIFPQPIGMSCSWDPELIERVYQVTSKEARARGIRMAYTPNADIARDPRFGRFPETYGEDTYLTTRMILSAVKGLQGDGKQPHFIATCKHFAGYAQVVGGTNFSNIEISPRTLIDEILPPFRAAVQVAKVQGIMPSHGDINGIPSHTNYKLLTETLRNEWGFEGIIVSDYDDIQRVFYFQEAAEDTSQAVMKAIRAGVDLELAGNGNALLTTIVQDHPEYIKYLDATVLRLLTAKFRMGLFENPYADPREAVKTTRTHKHLAIAKEIAESSIVLLKNQNQVLPLKKSVLKSIAVIGPNGFATPIAGYQRPTKNTGVFHGISNMVGNQVKVAFSEGCVIDDELSKMHLLENGELDAVGEKMISEALKAANNSDVVVLCLGENTKVVGESIFLEGHLKDRDNLNLVGGQEILFNRIAALGKPVIVVLLNGRPLSINKIAEKADAIVEAWLPGEFTGEAVANVLFGEVNPSGKLTATFPRSVGQLPVYYSKKHPTEKKGYLMSDSSPLFPFGFGLSYTTFEYSNLRLSSEEIGINEKLEVTINVKNVGDRAGKEIVQLYIRDKYASIVRPKKLLKGFDKIVLEPGETKTITFIITPDMLSFTGIDMEKVIESGDFDLMVGSSSEKYLEQTFTLKKN